MGTEQRCVLVVLLVIVLGCIVSAGEGWAGCITTECHQTLGQMTLAHAPVAEGECLACHRQQKSEHPLKGEKSFGLTADGAALCFSCHERFPAGTTAHAPVAEGNCLSCHNPHGDLGEARLVVKDGQQALCFQCHDAAMVGEQFVHGPAGAGACSQCHNPHGADQPALLRQESRQLCLSCHQELAAGERQAAVLHQPFAKKPCTACHGAHGAANPGLLTEKYPDLCFTCHRQVGKIYQQARVKHTALYKDDRCGNCHAAHFSKVSGLLQEREQDLCLRCHGVDDTKRSKPLKNIAKELQDKKVLHGPVADGRCAACHQPHGSDYFRLLSAAYPESFYAPYRDSDYDFCLSCHEKNLLRFADTTIYTSFRNGKQNLHYLHVANRRKGRTCRACHQAHASNGEKLINQEGAAFGDWRIPLRLALTPTGGSCAPGCHSRKAYDRQQPVDYGSKEVQ
ncbi:MAG: cytochrome C [Deltaproteobacteria bacterium]|nr:cytochrome C [Candidatus Anaeroferrophillus wilburensis]MBN2888535.1 cytochrome C [Deltaproteobacteria bacterium]